MKYMILMLAATGFVVLAVACSAAGAQPTATPAVESAIPAIIAPVVTGTPICPNAMDIIKAFYDANTASQYDTSLTYLTPDATLTTWAEGVEGRHWRETTLTGPEQIRASLGNLGLRRTSTTGQPDAIWHETEAVLSGNQVNFMMRPDRLGVRGKPHNPYQVKAVFEGCKIKSLTVVEFIPWE